VRRGPSIPPLTWGSAAGTVVSAISQELVGFRQASGDWGCLMGDGGYGSPPVPEKSGCIINEIQGFSKRFGRCKDECAANQPYSWY